MLNESKEYAIHYMEALVDIARESFLILDPKLKIISANPMFYQNFQVSKEETINKFVYDLGNGQWNIPELRRLLENVLPGNKIVKDFQVEHVFEKIGEKTMLLNARQLDSVQLIILAIEDVTNKKKLEGQLAEYTQNLEIKIAKRTEELATRVKELETLNRTMVGRELKMIELKEEIEKLKKRGKNGKNGNGKNGNGKTWNGK